MQLRTLRVRQSILAGLAALLIALFCAPLTAEKPREASPLAAALGVRFINDSSSSVILERDGREYIVDLATQTIRENETIAGFAAEPSPQQAAPSTSSASSGAAIFQQQCASCHGADGRGTGSNIADLTNVRARSGIPTERVIDVVTNGKSGTAMQGFSGRLTAAQIRDVAAYVQSLAAPSAQSDIYEAPDDLVYSLPTGRRLERGGLNLNFTHRFAYNPAFSGSGLGNTLLGFDGFAISSFGLRYGVTDKLSVGVFRSPSIIGRPIEFMAGYNVLDEHDNHPINAAFRISIDGQDNFRRNFTTNFEAIISRSISRRAQFYVVPTYSINNRRLVSKPGPLQNRPIGLPGFETLSIGAGLAVNIRPTVALIAEAIPTVVNADDLGIHRPAYSFGIQKQVRGHAFTLGLSQGPGTTISQRAGTRAAFLGDSTADKPKGLFIGFNLMRRLR